MLAPTIKTSLSKSIYIGYSKLIAAIAQIPAPLRSLKEIEGTGGKVSIIDLIAYQIGWGKLLISWYEAGIVGKKPEMPGDGFTTWDYVRLAQHFYTKYQFDGTQKQAQEFANVVARIIQIAQIEEQTGNINKLGVWQWCTLASGKQWPLSKWIQVNTTAPYKRATALIKKFAKTL